MNAIRKLLASIRRQLAIMRLNKFMYDNWIEMPEQSRPTLYNKVKAVIMVCQPDSVIAEDMEVNLSDVFNEVCEDILMDVSAQSVICLLSGGDRECPKALYSDCIACLEEACK